MAIQVRSRPITLSSIPRALARGGWVFSRSKGISLAVGGLFALIGTALVWGAVLLRLAPMTVPLLGGFLLVGPVVMAWLLGISQAVGRGAIPAWGDGFRAWRAAPGSLAAVSLFCLLIFFIWIGDAGTLFSFMVGEDGTGGDLASAWPINPGHLRFHLSAAVMGAVLAVVVFVVTVHAVPLLASGRATLVGAIVASVRAVFRSPVVHAAWALVLATGIFACLLVPPLLLVSLPVLAYGGHALHLEVFPMS